jgi:hypothetical protein
LFTHEHQVPQLTSAARWVSALRLLLLSVPRDGSFNLRAFADLALLDPARFANAAAADDANSASAGIGSGSSSSSNSSSSGSASASGSAHSASGGGGGNSVWLTHVDAAMCDALVSKFALNAGDCVAFMVTHRLIADSPQAIGTCLHQV